MSSEQETSRIWQWLTYTWVTPLLDRGLVRSHNKDVLIESDLLALPPFESPQALGDELAQGWAEEVKGPGPPSLARALRHKFGTRVFVGGLFRLLSDGFAFASPFLLRQLIVWLKDNNSSSWEGFIWVGALSLSNLCMSWMLNAASHHTITGFTQMAVALQVAIFEKILKLPPDHGETGHLTALHANDALRLPNLALMFHGLWVSPILLLAAFVALWFFMGYAGLIAIGIMVLTSPVQAVLMRKMFIFRVAIVKIADRRVHAINEALQGIRICKFMGWEDKFEERIAEIREEEVAVLKRSYYMRSAITVVANALPSLVSFALYSIAFGLDATIAPENVFPALAMLGVIRIPMMFLPMSIAMLMETLVSVKRIEALLVRKDVPTYLLPREGGGGELKNVSILAKDGTKILEGIHCAFPPNKLTAITGPTGCGKSTLVKSFIGESLVGPDSQVSVGGSVAYMSQEAWIMNATVRDNITFGQPMDEQRYQAVVAACQLRDDFTQLPNGDMTEIGERGVNLSGGQKQRIAFARAAYSTKDIVVMDDPLSAVDAHVCKALMEECILGFLKNRTRILVTHQVQFLPRCDHLIEMKDRKIVFEGAATDATNLEEDALEAHASDEDAAAGAAPSPTDGQKTTALMTKENMSIGDVSWRVYLWYARLGTVAWFLMTISFYLVWRLSTVMADLWLAWWSSKSDAFGRSFTQIEYLTYFGVTILGSIIVTYIRQLCLAVFSVRASRSSHAAMTKRILRAPTSFFDTTPMGRILNRFTKDMDSLDTKIPESIGMILMTFFNLLGTIALVIFSTPYIILLFPFLGVVLRFVYIKYTATVRAVKRLEGVSRSPVLAVVNETLGGLSSIRAYGMAEFYSRTHVDRANIAARAPYNTRCAQRWLSSRTELIGTSVLFVTSYVAALAHVLSGDGSLVSVSSSVIALSLTYVITTTNAVTFLNRTLADFEADMSSTERVMEYSTEVPQEPDMAYDADHPPPPEGWGLTGTIAFDRVCLRYREELPLVLQDVSFNIAPGEKVGIVGRTGSGKSTIILALFRMIEAEAGEIRIDGRATTSVTLKDLRSKITIIPQDPLLFAGTLRSNLDPFGLASDDDLWDALRKSNMDGRITMAGGLDSRVDDKGSNFSVGERQLLCLSRAMLKRCSILLLDEATASVDFEADRLIQETIRREFSRCTILTIAHRLATIIDGDKVIVMAEGRVAETGSPAELLRDDSGIFRSMVSQLGEEAFAELAAAAKEVEANKK